MLIGSVRFYRAFAIVSLAVAFVSGCDAPPAAGPDSDASPAIASDNVDPVSQTASPLRTVSPSKIKMKIEPGMSETEVFAQMESHGYITAPMQHYPCSDGGGIEVYGSADRNKQDYLFVVDWRGPVDHRSVRNYAFVKDDTNESIPYDALFQLLRGESDAERE